MYSFAKKEKEKKEKKKAILIFRRVVKNKIKKKMFLDVEKEYDGKAIEWSGDPKEMFGVEEKLVKKHHFNHQLQFFFPPHLKAPVDTDLGGMCYHLVQFPVQALLGAPFLQKLRELRITGISHRTKSDRTNSLCLLPGGTLLARLDKDSYQQFGLEGKKCDFPRKSKLRPKESEQFFQVEVNLLETKSKGPKVEERIKWCFSERFGHVQMLFCVEDEHSRCVEVDWESILGKDAKCKKFGCQVESLVCSSPSSHLPQHSEEDLLGIEEAGERNSLVDFAGLLSCGIETPQMEHKVCGTKISGFVSAEKVWRIYSKFKDMIKEEQDWVLLLVHGFEDCPVSWEHNQKGFLLEGDNHFLISSTNSKHHVLVFLGSDDSFNKI